MSTAWHICKGETNFVGKNQDVIYDGVYMYTNQRGLAKTAFILPPDQPASWVSIYGNLTVSQIGKECPNGGMNEEGLVVEQTTLWQAAYPAPDERPAVSELQWIQYMLDTCATVGEVLEAASRVRIAQNQSHLHYMVCDKRGDRAIIEFLNGEMAVYKDASLPCPVMANSLYKETIRTRHEPAEQEEATGDYEANSMHRFRKADQWIANKFELPSISIEDAFEGLREMRRPDTVFSLVYDLNRMEIHFTTSRNPVCTTVRVTDFDYSASLPGHILNMQLVHDRGSRIAHFDRYSAAANKQAVSGFFKDPILTEVFGWSITEEMIDFIATYPDAFKKI
ncbi:linear amide C-N hydrolase [Paenibacillus validus]|nr:linear amide C-N hydrolase [Paenibacillus validus]